MSPINRAKIPIRIEDAILFESDHTCCICRMKGKDVQIHHIDGNNSNRKPDNLAVVCLDCHSRVTGKRGLGKSYRPGEIRRYKRSWEMHVEDSRKIHRPQIKYKKELISHIDIIICEILAMKKNNSRVEELINVLYEIHLWRGDRVIDSKILEGLGHLAVMSGLDPSKIAPLVSDLTWDMSCHYVGPDYVAVKEKDVNYILKCVNVLETLSTFNCEFGHGRKAINSIAENLEKFFEIALWYATKKIANEPLPGLKPRVSGIWHTCHDLRPCQTCRKKPPLRQVPPGYAPKGCHSSPGLKAWGFLAYFIKSSISIRNRLKTVMMTKDWNSLLVEQVCGNLSGGSRYFWVRNRSLGQYNWISWISYSKSNISNHSFQRMADSQR